jgi:hypothetical protein
MRGAHRAWALLLALPAAGLAGCNGQEVPVFEVPGVAGSGGTAGATAGEAGAMSAGSAGDDMSLAGGGAAAGTSGATAGGGAGGLPPNSAGTAGTGGFPAKLCASRSDCPPNWLCEKEVCGAATGECQAPPPVFCPDEPKPVCGCNGVTYWNDCIRRQFGVQRQGQGECSVTARACDAETDCMVPFASCAHLVQGGETCHSGGPGACWVLPPQCRPIQGEYPIWQECHPPEAPPPPCLDTCRAIASGRRQVRRKPEDQCGPPP